MKKYILIIIFVLGVFVSFYSGYNATIYTHQSNLINTAMTNRDYNFFLQFNSHYDNEAELNSNNIQINKTYNSTSENLQYNIIVRGLTEEQLTQTVNDELYIKIYGEKTHTINTWISVYSGYNMLNLQVDKDTIIESVGDSITKIAILDSSNNILVTENTSIDVNDLTIEYMITQTQGFSNEELKEISTIKNYSDLAVQVGIFLGTYTILVLLFEIGSRLLKNKL